MEKGNKKLHFLDRYFGIPFVFILGLFKIKKKRLLNIESIQRIGILNPASIGDTVLIFGILKDLKVKYPHSQIVFFTGTSNYEMSKQCNYIDKIVKLKVVNPLECVKQIRSEGYFDIFIDCQPWPRFNSLMAFFSKSNLTVGFKTPNQYRHYVYDIIIPHLDNVHEIENLRNLIRPLGIHKFSFPELHGKLVNSERIACVHMFPSGVKSHLKMWTNTKWNEIIIYLQKEGFTVYITGGKADIGAADKFIEAFHLKDVVNVAGKFSLQQTIDLLYSSAIVISVNTGILHLASCLKVNLIGLHGPTSAKRWGPINENSFAIQSKHPDSPCLNLGSEYACGNDDCNCMDMISVEEVIEKINAFSIK